MIYDDSDNDSLVMDVIDHVCIYIYIYMYAWGLVDVDSAAALPVRPAA